jgi:hypothetical protein
MLGNQPCTTSVVDVHLYHKKIIWNEKQPQNDYPLLKIFLDKMKNKQNNIFECLEKKWKYQQSIGNSLFLGDV